MGQGHIQVKQIFVRDMQASAWVFLMHLVTDSLAVALFTSLFIVILGRSYCIAGRVGFTVFLLWNMTKINTVAIFAFIGV
jgi:hypothetical protein